MPTSTSELLMLRGITKRFTGVLALSAVDFTLRAGEIHALMGENGAGKSTLIKVLTGVYPRDAGTVHLNGEPFRATSPMDAQRKGISTVYQEVNLIPELSVAENLFIAREPRRLGMINWSAIRAKSRIALERLGLDLDVTRPVRTYSIAIQQMVAIARAVDIQAKVLILDEPTSSLDEQEVEHLFEIMRKLAGEGMGIVFVTHFMEQVYKVSNRITVLRNGQLVGSYDTASLPRMELIARMMGRDVEQVKAINAGHRATAPAGTEEFLEARGLGRRGSVQPIDMTVKKGEVVGLAGLLGSGRTEFVRLLFGMDAADSGRLRVEGRDVRIRSPRAAIREGMGFCPEDRKITGIVPDLSVRENILLVLQTQRGWYRPIAVSQQRQIVEGLIRALNIKTADAETPIKYLSGGNQQKAILARWLASNPKLLILDEPTRGIDVGAKFEIAKYIEEMRQKGMSIVFISSELEEVARSCQRVVVLRDRKKVGELSGAAISEEGIMECIAHGGKAAETARAGGTGGHAQ
ncbi:MAG TPA: sugar ABC transporter ATP-binding protein [Phycisphaerae bacterium]|nr:sugar ABC transporter ATP-binding protein [Phycisphaerae bacterium]